MSKKYFVIPISINDMKTYKEALEEAKRQIKWDYTTVIIAKAVTQISRSKEVIIEEFGEE